jgi:GNAT superfamily N-acetyltransferase
VAVEPDITLLVCPDLAESELHALFAAAWPQHDPERDFIAVLVRSPVYVCAYADERLVGFVYVAWDGGVHGFLLDPTVHPDWQHRGVGTALVHRAAEESRARGLHWLHVDYEVSLAPFYEACGFAQTAAGLIRLNG